MRCKGGRDSSGTTNVMLRACRGNKRTLMDKLLFLLNEFGVLLPRYIVATSALAKFINDRLDLQRAEGLRRAA